MFSGWSCKRETDRFVAEGCGRSRRPTENNGGIAKCGLSCWIHQLQTEATAQKILLTSWVVKWKISFENGPGFQAQIEDLHFKCCILGGNPKNKSTGRNNLSRLVWRGNHRPDIESADDSKKGEGCLWG